MVPDKKRPPLLLISLPAITFVTIAMLIWWMSKPRPFDSTQWKASTSRQRMVHDLLTNHTLKGKNHAQIDDLLGKPQPPDSVRDGHYIYRTGTDGVIDDMWLELRFEADRVVEVLHYPD